MNSMTRRGAMGLIGGGIASTLVELPEAPSQVAKVTEARVNAAAASQIYIYRSGSGELVKYVVYDGTDWSSWHPA